MNKLNLEDEKVKEVLFNLVPLLGLDVDGGIITINGFSYYVNIKDNTVRLSLLQPYHF